jgi:hypothetical protein
MLLLLLNFGCEGEECKETLPVSGREEGFAGEMMCAGKPVV